MYLFKRIANKTVAERRPRLAAIPKSRAFWSEPHWVTDQRAFIAGRNVGFLRKDTEINMENSEGQL